jgi:hypothetical protein
VFDPGGNFDYQEGGETTIVTLSDLMRDEHREQSNSTVTVTITGTNDAPIITASTLTPSFRARDVGAVLDSDDLMSTDVGSSTLIYTVDTLPTGILLINGTIAGAGDTFT